MTQPIRAVVRSNAAAASTAITVALAPNPDYPIRNLPWVSNGRLPQAGDAALYLEDGDLAMVLVAASGPLVTA